MPSANRVILLGHVGKADVRSGRTGDAAARIALATTRRWMQRSTGAREERTEWHKVVRYGRLAERVALQVRTGMSLYIEGCLRTRAWIDPDGVQREVTEVVAYAMQVLGDGPGGHAPGMDGGGGRDHDARRAHRPTPENADDACVKAYLILSHIGFATASR